MKEPKIFGLKTNNKLVYVGKTHCTNKEGVIIKSGIQTIYTNSKLRKLLINNDDVDIIPLKDSDIKNWYNDRNTEAHQKFIEGEKHLVNDPWVLEGKRCYWDGKKKDRHTIDRMSESKQKPVCQYDADGTLIKIWNSSKEIAINVFKDYRVVNGSAKSKIYDISRNKSIDKNFALGSYWIRQSVVLKTFKTVPSKLNINVIRKNQKKILSNKYKAIPYITTYFVKLYTSKGKYLKTYSCAKEAANDLGLLIGNVHKRCRRNSIVDGILWKYGKKHRVKK